MGIRCKIMRVAAVLTAGGSSLALLITQGDAAAGGSATLQASHREIAVGTTPAPDLTIRLDPEQNLTQALTDRGVSHLDAALVDLAAATASLEPSRPIKLWLGATLRGGEVRSVERLQARAVGGKMLTITRHGDEFLPTLAAATFDDTPVRFRLPADGRLYATLADAGLSRALAQRVSRLAVDGASIDLIVAHEEVSGRGSFGDPLYLGVTGRSGTVNRWLSDGRGELRLIKEAPATSSASLQRPVAGTITSGVGLRFHPILRFLRLHKGVDFAAANGTPVRAALSGKVVQVGWSGGYGRVVRVQHADGSSTLYAHLQDSRVAVGNVVAQGDALGSVGSTGLATGPHLHFEWTRDGRPLHPQFARPREASFGPDRSSAAALRLVLGAPFREAPARS